ncbi:peptidoglycan-binding domain-containing protein [Thalassorhabdomicrobium marinisediminis]|uniref:Peptidoglycan binding-like domain-containing protein n=1 Tax=Thalassorhabdomicrobium marinisediminis TaxID=2170577 RepID=A0A2T7G0D3_9RHOB|nr:peptidoglycan-binding protein [Thalassorhabdomicrobium marinisediminis]PVA07876.1 hypothetical protein DC363_04450 [Thalassorhabdomicrobium marinisediminis]
MRRLLLTTTLLLTGLAPLPALADDVALLLGAERYDRLDRVRRADNLLQASERLERLGFEVLGRANPKAGAATDLARAFQDQAAEAERLVVAMSGHFVTDGTRTWLLTAEARTPDLFSVQGQALSLDSVLQVLATRPGQAVLLLGEGDRRSLDLGGSALRPGVGALEIPQGVTVIRATPSNAAALLAGVLTEPAAELGSGLRDREGVTVEGFLPADWVLMPAEEDANEAPQGGLFSPRPPSGPSDEDLNIEADLWDRATQADTIEAYRTYINRYPNGRFAAEARSQIEEIQSDPNRNARRAEEALSLDRAARRSIQNNLTLLDYNTRGVDGIFGSGTRRAITNWQQSNGFPQTSYLTRDQISLLDAQAARRQAEIEAEEERERARAEARDRNYWSETGARGDAPGLRAYLDRYPDGLFSDIAKSRLATIEDLRREQAEAEDRAAWAEAREDDVIASYQEYLASYPSGVFAEQARARIEELSAPRVTQAQIRQARDEEDALRLSGIRAQLLELRLRDLGHNPGRLDGRVDGDTRDAIRAYQQSEGLTPTGYVDRATAVKLLTGSIGFDFSD